MAGRGFDDRYAGELDLRQVGPEAVVVGFQPPPLAYQHTFGEPLPAQGLPTVDIARFDADAGCIEIWPITIYPPKERFLQPRFKRLRSILFEGYDVRLPFDAEDVQYCLDVLPFGFFRDARFGLGLPKMLLPIVKEIERVRDVTHLIISRSRWTKVEKGALVLSHDEYERAARSLQRVSERHQRRSLEERHAYARNRLISPLDPKAYPEERPPYTEDTVFEILNVTDAAKLKLSQKDKASLVREVTKRTPDLSAEAPEALFRLHRKIELVNLDTLIENFQTLLSRPGKREKQWQRLFELNPFILSMVFGYPIVVVMREATVGGPLLDGRGAKIADFLVKNPMTSNAALVELKTPQQPLLGAIYAGASDVHPIHPPHHGLAGAVAQVQDQAYRLQKRIDGIVADNDGLILKTFRVDCVVVAGLKPGKDAERQAFELYRQGLKDVRIVTFDELLVKLESLRELLAQSPAPERFEADDGTPVESDSDGDAWDYAEEDEDEDEDERSPSPLRRRRRRM